MESCIGKTCNHANNSSWWEGTQPFCTDFTILSPAFFFVCDVFLLLKENVEVMRWESRNLISVNSSNCLPHSILWHWCALLVSRNTGVLFCVCVFHLLTRKIIPTWPMKRHVGTIMNVDQKIIVFSVSEMAGNLEGLCWGLLIPSVLNIIHVASTFSTKELHWKIDYLSGHKPFPLTLSLWRKF